MNFYSSDFCSPVGDVGDINKCANDKIRQGLNDANVDDNEIILKQGVYILLHNY